MKVKINYYHLFIIGVLLHHLKCDIFDNVYYPGKSGTLLENENDFYVLPRIHQQYRRRERKTKFTGTYNGSLITSYEQRNQVFQFDTDEQNLSWETMVARSGRRIATYIRLDEVNTIKSNPYKDYYLRHHRRNKRSMVDNKQTKDFSGKRHRRNIYGRDDRTFIPVREEFGLKEPYVYTVKLSTGCTGIVISPRHVLTAAHCVHDQKDYLSGTKNMTVGFLLDKENIKWIAVKSIKVSKGWIEGGVENGPFYDYALVRLAKKHDRPYIKLSISEEDHHGAGERISFTSFDDDKPENTMWYRSCNVVEDDPSFLYHYCDAKPGSSGSGVYSWVYDDIKHQWTRALVGVFSGNRWRIYDEFYIIVRNFNVAVRMTKSRYAQICKWLGKYAKEVCHIKNRENKQEKNY